MFLLLLFSFCSFSFFFHRRRPLLLSLLARGRHVLQRWRGQRSLLQTARWQSEWHVGRGRLVQNACLVRSEAWPLVFEDGRRRIWLLSGCVCMCILYMYTSVCVGDSRNVHTLSAAKSGPSSLRTAGAASGWYMDVCVCGCVCVCVCRIIY